MKLRLLVALVPTLVLAACGSASPTSQAPPVGPGPASVPPSAAGSPPGPTAAPGNPGAMDLAAFERIELTDVRTGEHFNLGGFQGKQVIIEGMATW